MALTGEQQEQLTAAKLRLYEAKTELLLQDALMTAARVREAVAEADAAEVQTRLILENEDKRLAKDEYAHIYVFNGRVEPATIQKCVDALSEWSRREPGCDIEIIFNSPGGSVIDGMFLFDHIQALRMSGHKVTTTTLGMAASMAGILLQAGDVRVMGAESYLLIHEVAAGAIGKIGEIEDEVELLKKMMDRTARIFANRSKLTASQVKNKMRRKDWWIDSAEALRLGLVDEVRSFEPKDET